MEDIERRIASLNEPLEVLVVLATTLEPLIANLLENPTLEKYQKVRLENVHVRRACALVGVPELLREFGFLADGTGVYLVYDGSRDLYLSQGSLLRLRSAIECQSTRKNNDESRRRELVSRAAKQQEERQKEEDASRLELATVARLHAEDAAYGKSLEPVIMHALHKTHRIRNHLRDALHMQCCRMTSKRHYVECTTCDPSGIEVHWHTRTSNMLYAYVVHMTPDGTSVVHNGPVLGFMYDSDPRSQTFGNSVMFSRQHPDLTGREGAKAQLRFTHESTVVTKCPYCQKDFASELWV